MRCVFFDLSKWNTAICIMNNTHLEKFIAFTPNKTIAKKDNTIYLDKKLTDEEVIEKQINIILPLIDEYEYFGFEKDIMVHNAQGWKDLYSVVRYFINHKNKKLIEIYPTSLKKFAIGTGKAEKDNLAIHCYKEYGHDFSDYLDCSNNIVDAFYGGLFTYMYFNIKENNARIRLKKYQQEVLNSFLKPVVKKTKKGNK